MKKFVLGLGAQKSGTTWLHYYLSEQPFSDFGFKKEYHVFDAVTLGPCAHFYKRTVRKVKKGFKRGKPDCDAIYKLNFMLNPESYFDYFASKLENEPIELTGDITPSYSGLSVETLETINSEFGKRGVTVFPIFLMRDPVYRLQSRVRMHARKDGKILNKQQELRRMKNHQGTDGDNYRSTYQTTLSNAYTVFGRKNVYVQLYEDLFTPASTQKLGQFLKVDLEPAPFETKKNVSKTNNNLTNAEYDTFREIYKPVYDEVARLTDLDIDTHWKYIA